MGWLLSPATCTFMGHLRGCSPGGESSGSYVRMLTWSTNMLTPSMSATKRNHPAYTGTRILLLTRYAARHINPTEIPTICKPGIIRSRVSRAHAHASLSRVPLPLHLDNGEHATKSRPRATAPSSPPVYPSGILPGVTFIPRVQECPIIPIPSNTNTNRISSSATSVRIELTWLKPNKSNLQRMLLPSGTHFTRPSFPLHACWGRPPKNIALTVPTITTSLLTADQLNSVCSALH